MNKENSTILENKMLTNGVYRMTLETEKNAFTAPGQFAMLEVPQQYLRRPISVSTYSSTGYSLIYKVVGTGTTKLSRMKVGDKVSSLTGLGNGYDLEAIPGGSTIIGGGIGIPPMLGLARSLKSQNKEFQVILGFNTAEEMFLLEDFKEITDDIIVMTADGSFGQKGFVTDAFDQVDYACACGPLKMLEALASKVKAGQFSLEARMGCGFGACMGCSIQTAEGYQRVCKEGPVFNKEVLLWETL